MGTLVPRKGRLKITIYPSTLNTGDPATHYRIEYREKGESGWRTLRVVDAPAPIPPSMMPPSVSMTVPPPARPMVQHTGLSDGVTYEYQVFSIVTGNNFEESSWAASCVGTTPGAEVVDVRTQQPAFIAAPECVGAAYERSEDAINLTWSHTSDQGIPASVFRIEVAKGTTGLLTYASLAQLMASGGPEQTLLVRNLESEQFYTFRIFALGNHPTDGLLESPPSSNFDTDGNPVCSFVWLPGSGFPKPQNFRVVEQSGDAITLRWDPPPDVSNVFDYQLEYRPEGQTAWDHVADFESTQKYSHPYAPRNLRTQPRAEGNRNLAIEWDPPLILGSNLPPGKFNFSMNAVPDYIMPLAPASLDGGWSDGTTIFTGNSASSFIHRVPESDRTTSLDPFEVVTQVGDLWGNATTIWATHQTNVSAYDKTTGDRDADQSFTSTNLEGDTPAPRGIWSDGTTVWISDNSAAVIYAYELNTKTRSTGLDIPTMSENNDPSDLWSDGVTMWVLDATGGKLYAYRLRDQMYDFGQRT